MAKKILLARFTREKPGGKEGETETLLPDGKPVDLSKDDIATLDRLTKATGKRYYRDPVNEGGSGDEDEDDSFTMPGLKADQLALAERWKVDLSGTTNEKQRLALLQAHYDEHGDAPAPAEGGGEGGGEGGDKDEGL